MKHRLAFVLAALAGLALYILLHGEADARDPVPPPSSSRAAGPATRTGEVTSSLVAPATDERLPAPTGETAAPAAARVAATPTPASPRFATLRVTVVFAPNDRAYAGIPVRLTRRLAPVANEPPHAPIDAVTREGGVVDCRVPAGSDLDLEIPVPWYFEPHDGITWGHGPRQILALEPDETRDVTVGFWSIHAEATFGARVLSMEGDEPLRGAFAFPIVDDQVIPYEPAKRMRLNRHGTRSNSKGSIQLNSRWWPDWAVFVQCDGHAPRIVAPGPMGLHPREPRSIRLPVASSIRGRLNGIPLQSTSVFVILEVAAQDLTPPESPDLRLPSAKVAWTARVRGSGTFELGELPPETKLRLVAMDQSGEVLGSLTPDALEPGEVRRLDWTLE